MGNFGVQSLFAIASSAIIGLTCTLRAAEPASTLLEVRGAHYPYYRLAEAAEVKGVPLKSAYALPESIAGYKDCGVAIVNDMAIARLSEAQVAALSQFVADGGGLLVIGGHNAFAGGLYKAPENGHARLEGRMGRKVPDDNAVLQMLPVILKERFDVVWLKPPRAITPENKILHKNVDWSEGPLVIWLNTFERIKKGATVLARAGEDPAVIAWRWKKGRVAVLATTCYGVVPSGESRAPFWDWNPWPTVMANLLEWLTQGE